MKKIFFLSVFFMVIQFLFFAKTPSNVILLEAPKTIPFNMWREELKERGIVIAHAFPPAGGLVVSYEDSIPELFGIEEALNTRIFYDSPTGEDEKRIKETTEGNILWNVQRKLLQLDGKCDEKELHQGLPLINDFFIPEVYQTEKGEPLGSCSSTYLKYSGSEYLLGSVSVNVILPESNGVTDPSTENWDSTLETNVANEIAEGLDELRNLYTIASSLKPSFTYHYYYGRTDTRARTQYEPINRNASPSY
ncbi:MAG: hypothetical protein N2445_06010, partial [Acidobacteria bacterium]|nr:hypothetical protein [Acidobacteriota bacterium]